ncbi:acyl-CoA N-acyltransferase [Irpex rosettiformis]|uniref:Acyl-CoA N-acyltransferase n=1 Tax=Irpex rosettiformis TaxID=378272 RepID=A0ACB8U3U6_9APHY|nr:acyl-CoA N-acyltransferase [Irpex rosettiformis]
MSIPPHEIIVIPAFGEEGREVLWQQCFDVRLDVFHHEQGFPAETEKDDLEDVGTHFLLRLTPSLKPVGTIRATRGNGYYKLSRLAVLKDYRQYRFGRELVQALEDWVRADAKNNRLSVAKIHSHSQLYVKPFYAKFGYESEGDEFDEDGAPHQLMVCTVQID